MKLLASFTILLLISFNLKADKIDTIGQPLVVALDTTICPGEQIFGYDEPGSYMDTILNSAGLCDSVITNINLDLFPQTPDIQISETVCNNDTMPGTYTEILIDPNGCEYKLITQLVLVSIQGDDREYEICPGDSVVWLDKVYTEAGLYIETIRDSTGCDIRNVLFLSFLENSECTTSTESIPNHLEIRLYPNPATNFLTVEGLGSNQESHLVELISSEGQTIYSYLTNEPQLQIDVNELPQGLYLTKIRSQKNEAIKTIAFLKE